MVQLFILLIRGGGQDLRQLDASSFGLANGRQMLAFPFEAEKGTPQRSTWPRQPPVYPAVY